MTRAGYLLSEAYAEEERFDAVMEKGASGGKAAAIGGGLAGVGLLAGIAKFAGRNKDKLAKAGKGSGVSSMAKEGGSALKRELGLE